MSVEELRKIAKEEASKFIMENLNSAIIFTYIQNLEKEIENLKEINKEHQKLNGKLRKEIEKDYNIKIEDIRYNVKEKNCEICSNKCNIIYMYRNNKIVNYRGSKCYKKINEIKI